MENVLKIENVLHILFTEIGSVVEFHIAINAEPNIIFTWNSI